MVTFAKVLNLHFSADTPRPYDADRSVAFSFFFNLQSEPPKKTVGSRVTSILHLFRGESRNPSETRCIFGHFWAFGAHPL